MRRIILTLICILLLCACSNSSKTVQIKNDDKFQVYTSFYAIYDIVSQIAGDKVEVINIIPTGTEPHDWEPTAHDMLSLESAEILFYNGLGMETWLERVQNSISNTELQYIELSSGISTLEAHHDHDDDAESHIHDDSCTHDHEYDPHIWLDPKNTIIMAETVAKELCELDSSNSDYYTSNLELFREKALALDENFSTSLEAHRGKAIVVAHEAYSYLANAYNLEQVAIEGVSGNSEPSAQRMKEIIEYINQNSIGYIFYEELVSPKVAQAIADETSATLLPLNPFEGLSEEDIAAGKNYFTVMEENLENIVTSFEK